MFLAESRACWCAACDPLPKQLYYSFRPFPCPCEVVVTGEDVNEPTLLQVSASTLAGDPRLEVLVGLSPSPIASQHDKLCFCSLNTHTRASPNLPAAAHCVTPPRYVHSPYGFLTSQFLRCCGYVYVCHCLLICFVEVTLGFLIH